MTAASPPNPGAVVCLITAPQGSAERLAAGIVELRLAACVNIVPLVHSVYLWQGSVAREDEALLIAKSTSAAIPDLERFLRDAHPYDTFELLALDVAHGSMPYLGWIANSVGPGD